MRPTSKTSLSTVVVEPPRRRAKPDAVIASSQHDGEHANNNNSINNNTNMLGGRLKVDQGIVDELLLVCGVIGTSTSDDQTLVPVTDCLNWLQDLQRALRRDDDNYRPISLLMGKWKVVQQKLLPLIMSCRYDTPIVLTIVKILVILTKPLNETTKRAGTMVIDTKSGKVHESVIKQQVQMRDNALEQSQMLMDYKRAITHHPSHLAENRRITGSGGLLSVVVSLLAEPLSKTGTGRSDADHLTIELVLHLLRNLLSTEPILKGSTSMAQQSNQLHLELISLLGKELVLEILLVVGQDMESRENSPYNLLMMEILHHLLRSQDPTAVARVNQVSREKINHLGKTSSSGTKSLAVSAGGPTAGALRSKLQKEKQRLQGVLKCRHSNFGGTLVVNRSDGKRQLQSVALMDRIGIGPPPANTAVKRKNRKTEPFLASSLNLAAHTRRITSSTETLGPVAQEAQKTLHDFSHRFIEKCYGPVMKSLKNEFRRDSARLENDDKVIFFRIVWFFSQWWRVSKAGEHRHVSKSVESEATDERSSYNGGLGQLIFTMDIFTFNLVLNATDTFYQYKQHSQLAQAVALYNEMMHLLHQMNQSEESTEQVMALGLMDRLFYASEPLDRLPKLLSRWSPSSNTRDYMCDLVELCHVTLKLLESHSKNVAGMGNQVHRDKVDTVTQIKENAADFDFTAYLSRKIISNHVVTAYTHVLQYYSINAPIINHHIIAFFLRLSKFNVAIVEDEEMGLPNNLLATKSVTLEPMLYNIKLIMALNVILNDNTIRHDPEFAGLLTFAVEFMNNFYHTCQFNPLVYVECLFRHVAPHRFCDLSTNLYVSEELRMIAERELLLEETRKLESRELEDPAIASDDEEAELEFFDDDRGDIVAAPRQVPPVAASGILLSGRAGDESNDNEEDSRSSLRQTQSLDDAHIVGNGPSKRRFESENLMLDNRVLVDKPKKKIARVIESDSSDDEELVFG